MEEFTMNAYKQDYKTHVNLTMDHEVLRVIDMQRHMIKRSTYVNYLLRQSLGLRNEMEEVVA